MLVTINPKSYGRSSRVASRYVSIYETVGMSIAYSEQNGEASYTYGCLDPVMVTQMAKYLDTVYVSGWQCSSTASSSDEPGPDLADYPMVSSRLGIYVYPADGGRDHGSKQSPASLVCSAFPRPKAKGRAPQHPQVSAWKSSEHRFPSPNHRRC